VNPIPLLDGLPQAPAPLEIRTRSQRDSELRGSLGLIFNKLGHRISDSAKEWLLNVERDGHALEYELPPNHVCDFTCQFGCDALLLPSRYPIRLLHSIPSNLLVPQLPPNVSPQVLVWPAHIDHQAYQLPPMTLLSVPRAMQRRADFLAAEEAKYPTPPSVSVPWSAEPVPMDVDEPAAAAAEPDPRRQMTLRSSRAQPPVQQRGRPRHINAATIDPPFF
jgi:hypothetical protein